MYYLFMTKKKDIENYKRKFDEVKQNIADGKTPVYSELRAAKSSLIESVPYNTIQAVLMVISTIVLAKVEMGETLKVAMVLVVNSLCGAISNYIFAIGKHFLRSRLCHKMGIEPTEENVAVMESLEYQTV